jgi:UDP-N-acetylmuramate--alanine ligase
VAFSPAVSPDNVELAAAHKLGIPTLSYPQMVGLLMRQRLGVAVAGTHGKSTTTAMTASIFREAGLDPTVFVGATPLETSSATAFGRGPVMLAEACEYRESFLHLHPQVAALLGIDWDHVDCFRSPAAVAQAFRRFVAGIPIGGKLVVAVDCAASRTIARESGLRHETFGFGVDADWRAAEVSQCLGRYRFRIEQGNVNLGRLRLQVIGRHQVRCALAAAALAGQFGVSAAHILAGLARYAGLERRLELLGEPRGVAVVDDYAHHPTAVRASLASVREAFPDRQVWCVFEPHQAIRTRTLLDDFARSLQNADRIAVADVQLAREPMPSTPSGKASLARAIAEELSWAARAMGRSVALEHTRDEISVLLTRALRPGDVLVTMGAGNIGKCAHEFIHRL